MINEDILDFDEDDEDDFDIGHDCEMVDSVCKKYSVGEDAFLFKNNEELNDIVSSLINANYLKYEIDVNTEIMTGILVIQTHWNDWSISIPETHMVSIISLDNIFNKLVGD